MATYTTLAVSNQALVLCGASPITALTDDTPNARALNAVYTISKKAFLTECKWNFSTTRSTLVTASTATLAWLHDEEAYAYVRPDALRVWEVSDQQAVWREEGDYIIADTGSLGAKWTFEVDIGKFSPKAITAFIDKLCSDICFMILNSTPKAESFLAKYEKVSLPQAKTENSQTGTQQVPIDDAWISSKYANGGGGNPARSYS